MTEAPNMNAKEDAPEATDEESSPPPIKDTTIATNIRLVMQILKNQAAHEAKLQAMCQALYEVC
jgi:hypothetical protein